MSPRQFSIEGLNSLKHQEVRKWEVRLVSLCRAGVWDPQDGDYISIFPLTLYTGFMGKKKG